MNLLQMEKRKKKNGTENTIAFFAFDRVEFFVVWRMINGWKSGGEPANERAARRAAEEKNSTRHSTLICNFASSNGERRVEKEKLSVRGGNEADGRKTAAAEKWLALLSSFLLFLMN